MLRRILLVLLLTIASAVIVMAQAPTMRPFYNKANRIGVSYPTDWRLGKQKVLFEDEEPGFTVLADLMPASLQGSVYQAEVAVSVAKMDESACKAMNIGNIQKVKDRPPTIYSGGITFSFLEAADKDTVGKVRTTHYYRTYLDGRCYELAFLKWGDDTAERPDKYERELDKQYNAILGSVFVGGN